MGMLRRTLVWISLSYWAIISYFVGSLNGLVCSSDTFAAPSTTPRACVHQQHSCELALQILSHGYMLTKCVSIRCTTSQSYVFRPCHTPLAYLQSERAPTGNQHPDPVHLGDIYPEKWPVHDAALLYCGHTRDASANPVELLCVLTLSYTAQMLTLFADRLENEHLGNVDQYRVTREVPLPYAVDENREYDQDDDDERDRHLRLKR